MSKSKSKKNHASTLATSLVPVGALAVAAGCGGGGSAIPAAHANANTNATTPVGASTTPLNGPKVAAQLTLTVPARGTQKLGRRNAQYISPASAAVGVIVAQGTAAQPQQLFTLPTPGPAPATTTLPIQATVGTDTITVNVYDANPSATASPNLLSTGSTTTTIAPTALNTPSVTALGVPAGVALTVANAPTAAPTAGATARPWTPLENVAADQSVTVNATAYDADDFAITGSLATAAPLTVTGPVTLSASSITSGTATVTATYPHGSTTAGTIGSSLPQNVSNVVSNIVVTPDYGVFVTGGGASIDVVDGVDHSVHPVTVGSSSGRIAAASCGSGGVAVAADANAVDIVSLAPSTAANPVPSPTATSVPVSGLAFTSGVALDPNCNAYVATVTSTVNVYQVSGLGGSPLAAPYATVPTPSAAAGGVSANLSVAQNNLYVGEAGSGGAPPFGTISGATYKVAVPTTGTPVSVDTNALALFATSNGTLYQAWNLSGGCVYATLETQAFQAGSADTTATYSFPENAPTVEQFAGSSNALYILGSGGNLYTENPPLTGSTLTALTTVGTPTAFALSPDPTNTYVCTVSGQSLNFYVRSSLGSTQSPATVSVASQFSSTYGVAAAP